MQLTKDDFDVSHSDLDVLLEVAKQIIVHNGCSHVDAIRCNMCPLGSDVIHDDCCCKFERFDENPNKILAVKQFIKLFSKENEMNQKEIYKWMQMEWITKVDLNVGDEVKIIGTCRNNQFGYSGTECEQHYIDKIYIVGHINHNYIKIVGVGNFPFFCLEKVPESQIEITVKINGKEGKLKDISEETLKRIRNM